MLDSMCLPRSAGHLPTTFYVVSGSDSARPYQEAIAPIQRIQDPFLEQFGVELYLKREDLIHSEISGNKWRKLKYNVLQAAADGNQVRLEEWNV